MRNLLTLTTAILLATTSAHAIQITTFGQTSNSNTVIATDNGTQTNITITDATVDVTQLFNNTAQNGVDFSLSATSTDAAQQVGNAVIQHFAGTFCLTASAGCTGTNFLSGSFSDAAFGGLGGPGLVINTNNPPDTLTLTSDVITIDNLAAPNAFNLTFTNLSSGEDGLAIDGSTIAAFDASFGGNASASVVDVNEPSSLAILGMGLLGIGMIRRKLN